MLNAESAVLRAEVGRREREGALTPEEAAEELKGIDARAEALWLAAVQAAATELVAEIRAEVASSGRVAMNAEPLTVPEGLLRSATSVLRYHLLTRYNCQISDDRKQTYLDAKELLAAAGYAGEKILLVTTPDYPAMYNATLVVHAQLVAAGINAEVEQYDFATFMEHRANPDQFSLYITSNSYNILPVTLSVLNPSWAGLDAAEVPAGIAAIKAAATTADAAAEWQALEEFLYDYGAASVLGHYSDVSATAVGVEGFNYFNFPIYWNVKVPA